MVVRHGWVLLACLGLSCHSALPMAPVATEPAGQAWEQGQEAMRAGQIEEAIRCYERSLQLDPTFTRTHLSLAAARLEHGELAAACPHLAEYVAAHPEQLGARAHYAELLLKLRRLPEARCQFERLVADTQNRPRPSVSQLIHSHGRLMEIAEAEHDVYAEHLNRGIGLYLLACEREAVAAETTELPAEGIFCKAAGELTLARLERPEEARPAWYLYEVWRHLGQRQPAARWLREADREAPFTYLTPAEQRSLAWARQRADGARP